MFIYYICHKTSKLSDHGNDFKWSILGGGQYIDLEYCYNGIEYAITWDPYKASNIREWLVLWSGRLEMY